MTIGRYHFELVATPVAIGMGVRVPSNCVKGLMNIPNEVQEVSKCLASLSGILALVLQNLRKTGDGSHNVLGKLFIVGRLSIGSKVIVDVVPGPVFFGLEVVRPTCRGQEVVRLGIGILFEQPLAFGDQLWGKRLTRDLRNHHMARVVPR